MKKKNCYRIFQSLNFYSGAYTLQDIDKFSMPDLDIYFLSISNFYLHIVGLYKLVFL